MTVRSNHFLEKKMSAKDMWHFQQIAKNHGWITVNDSWLFENRFTVTFFDKGETTLFIDLEEDNECTDEG